MLHSLIAVLVTGPWFIEYTIGNGDLTGFREVEYFPFTRAGCLETAQTHVAFAGNAKMTAGSI